MVIIQSCMVITSGPMTSADNTHLLLVNDIVYDCVTRHGNTQTNQTKRPIPLPTGTMATVIISMDVCSTCSANIFHVNLVIQFFSIG
jgi:hypothetical protein